MQVRLPDSLGVPENGVELELWGRLCLASRLQGLVPPAFGILGRGLAVSQSDGAQFLKITITNPQGGNI
jgi:hypothetical protein